MEYDGDQYQTLLVNEIAEHIFLINKKLEGKKKGEKAIKNLLPHYGWNSMLLSSDFIFDLTRLAHALEKMTEIDPQLNHQNLTQTSIL
jgi:hypothetical protein